MKTKNLWKRLTLMMVSLISAGVFLLSCGEPEDVGPNGGTTNPDKVVADPEGTIILSMRDFDNGNIRIDDKIYINKENWTGEGCSFVSVGEMKGLGNIESIPTTGWANQMGVYPDNGYVAYNRANDAYYRLFVTEYLYNTSEEIIGAKVKYQKPFCGRDEALKTETKDLSFTAEGGTEKVFFKNSSIVPFTVSNSQSWCRVQRISSSDNAFLYDGISVTTLASGLPTMSSDTITLETLYGKTHTIVVQREGHAYLEASAESLDFTAYSGSSTLMLKTNMKWEAYASDSWIELSPTSGDGNAYVKVSVTANDSGKSRTGTVKFVADGKSASVAISQAGGSLSVSPTTLEIVEGGGTKTLKLTTPSTWTATASEAWLKTTPESGSGDATLTVIVEANNSTSTRTGTITFTSVDCTETVVVNQAGGKLSVSSSTLNFGDVGDTMSLKVQASNETLIWTAGTEDAWLRVSPDSGSGSATLMVTAEANNSAANRTGTVTITSGETTLPVTVTQTGGSFSLSASTLSFIDAGESKSLTITTTTSLPWTATSASSWLKVSPESGNGSATLSVSAEANNSTAERTGKLFIVSGDKSIPVVVTQSGGSLSVSASSLSFVNAGETKSLNLQASNSMLAWSAIINDSWIKVSPESGNGSAMLSVSAEANISTSERTGKLTIVSGDVSIPITIIQAGGTVSVSPTTLDFMDRGDVKPLNITTPFTWTATSSESWLKLSSTSGNGNATLSVTAEANNSTANRTGTLTIITGDKTISITASQAGGSLSVSSSVLYFIDAGETKSLKLTTTTSLSWTANVSASWLKISQDSGTGDTTLSITAETNVSTSDRIATVVFASGNKSSFVDVTQVGGNLYVSPSSTTISEKGGSFPIELTTSTPFAWTATASASWMRISSSSGNGSAKITVNVSANNSPAERNGMITFTSQSKSVAVYVTQSGIYIGTDWVNLGLPSGNRWATKNVGASTPEDHGEYFAWGEIKSKNEYSWSNYVYCCNANLKLLSKYNCDQGDGVVDNLTTLQKSDDVANQITGGVMPTKIDWSELLEKCTWTWITLNSVQGYKVVGPNGNLIFLPVTGYKKDKSISNTNNAGCYWSSSLYEVYAEKAWSLYFTSSNAGCDTRERNLGYCVRPVYKP
jgi:hypothetical protein